MSMKRKKTSDLDLLNDRERILMEIIDGLYGTQLRTDHKAGIQKSDDYADHDGYLDVHFNIWREPKPGDLVMGRSGRIHAWKIGWYVSKLHGNFGGAMIREIGTDRLCEYVNETFFPIVGLRKADVLEGEQQAMLVKVLKAFRDGDSDVYRFGGIEFKEPRVAKVWIREKHGGIGDKTDNHRLNK